MSEKKISKLIFSLSTHTLIKRFYNQRRQKEIINNYFNNDKKYLCEMYRLCFGKTLNLDNPQTFNEKLNWEKLYWRSDIAKKCADKFTVRDYVQEKGLGACLNPLYGVYENVDEIKWDYIPEQFVIKTTNDSGSVFICHNKSSPQFLKEIAKKTDMAMHKPPYNLEKEWVYDGAKRRIVIEKLIQTTDGHSPKDYKFFCFNGKVKCLFVGSNRDSDIRFDFFLPNWTYLGDVYNGHRHAKKTPERPNNLSEMISIAEQLSTGFAHVRVDLYNENNSVIFGEMTFFHFGGFTPFFPNSFDSWLGEDFDLSKIPESELIK